MVVKDLIKKVDIDKQVELICLNRESYEKPYDKDKVKCIQNNFINKLLSLEPKKTNDSIIIFEKYWDGFSDEPIKEYVGPKLYKKEDLILFLKDIKENDLPLREQEFNENMDSLTLKSLVEKFPTFPNAYAFEFELWEEILGYEVYEKNLNSFDLQECIYKILFEMSFNGFDEESQQERRDELTETIKHNEELMALPEEERSKHFKSFEEVKEHLKLKFDWKEPSEEEKERDNRRIWFNILKTMCWRYKNYLSIRKDFV